MSDDDWIAARGVRFDWSVGRTDDGMIRLGFDTPLGPFITDMPARAATELSAALVEAALEILLDRPLEDEHEHKRDDNDGG